MAGTPGFPASRPDFTDTTWALFAPSSVAEPMTGFALVAALATIQAVVAASQEHEHVVSLELERERIVGATLTAQRLILDRNAAPLPSGGP